MTIKRIRTDERGNESLLPVIVFIVAFISTTVILIKIISMSLLGMAGGISDSGVLSVDEAQYQLFDPASGYNITTNDTQKYWDHESTSNLHFDGSPYDYDEDYTVAIIRYSQEQYDFEFEFTGVNYNWLVGIYPQFFFGNGQENLFSDYVMVYFEHSISLTNTDTRSEIAIPLNFIVANQRPNTNVSIANFELHSQLLTLAFMTPGNQSEHEMFIWHNQYRLFMGVDLQNYTLFAEVGTWKIVTQMLTAQLPDVDPVFSLMLAAPIWAAILVVSVTIVSRYIPLIPGG